MTWLTKLGYALHATWGFALGDLTWYVLFAGGLWLGFYVLLRAWLRRRKIVPKMPPWSQLGWEVFYSVRSVFVFGLTGGVIVYLELSGIHTRIYRHIDTHGWGWYAASILIAVAVHDTYFYWSHRLLHHPLLFRRLHRTHHLSNNPTPWAAYSFSTGEALIQSGIGPLLVYTVPMHYSAFLLFMIWQISFNVLGHCGYEILPSCFMRSGAGRFLNTVTHHAMHHEKVGANFGLYFNIWDRLMGTNHAEYEHRFEQITASGRTSPTGLDSGDQGNSGQGLHRLPGPVS